MNDDTLLFDYSDKLTWMCNNNIFNYICYSSDKLLNPFLLQQIKKDYFFNYPVNLIRETNIYKLRDILFNEMEVCLVDSIRGEFYAEYLRREISPGMNTFNVLNDLYNIDFNIYLYADR